MNKLIVFMVILTILGTGIFADSVRMQAYAGDDFKELMQEQPSIEGSSEYHGEEINRPDWYQSPDEGEMMEESEEDGGEEEEGSDEDDEERYEPVDDLQGDRV